MCRCPFLSTHRSKVSCFKECAFYDYGDIKEECPFKYIDTQKNMVKALHYNELFKNEELNILDELFQEKNYINIFQI